MMKLSLVPVSASLMLALAACGGSDELQDGVRGTGATTGAGAGEPTSTSSIGSGAGGSGGAGEAGGGGGTGMLPQGVVNGVMLQGFYWNVPKPTADSSWWKMLETRAGEIADAGITSVWIPPPYKGHVGLDDVGYGVYDRYDLGEFDQKGTVSTRYGTRAELEAAIAALHAHGVRVYADIVMNHMMGGDATEDVTTLGGETKSVKTRFDHAGRGDVYSAFHWDSSRFNGYQSSGTWKQWHAWDFEPYANGSAYDNLLGCEIRYADPEARAETIAWGQWITGELDLDGYRLDAAKHMLTSFVNEWLDAVRGERFAVGEAWWDDVDLLKAYIDATGGRMHLFDVPLHYRFHEMSLGDGSWDMKGLKFAGLAESRGDLAVTFVDNHDTVNEGALSSPVEHLQRLAYAYILTRAKAYPTVFYKDYDDSTLGEQIRQLIAIRKAHAYGKAWEYDASDEDVYLYSRAGDETHTGLLLVLNDGAAATRSVKTPFHDAKLTDETGNSAETVTTDADGNGTFPVAARSYGVWVPAAP